MILATTRYFFASGFQFIKSVSPSPRGIDVRDDWMIQRDTRVRLTLEAGDAFTVARSIPAGEVLAVETGCISQNILCAAGRARYPDSSVC